MLYYDFEAAGPAHVADVRRRSYGFTGSANQKVRNARPVGIMGVGDRRQIIKGDAYYQSYICHLPRGIIEMALDKTLDSFDGFLFPAICDCIRNLSGMFRLLNKGRFARYFDYPQNYNFHISGTFYRDLLETVMGDIF